MLMIPTTLTIEAFDLPLVLHALREGRSSPSAGRLLNLYIDALQAKTPDFANQFDPLDWSEIGAALETAKRINVERRGRPAEYGPIVVTIDGKSWQTIVKYGWCKAPVGPIHDYLKLALPLGDHTISCSTEVNTNAA
jgi:hypothetical protein